MTALKENVSQIEILDWQVLPYGEALERQHALVEERIEGRAADRLILVQHPPVVTLGRSGGSEDLRISEDTLRCQGIETVRVERGGRATYHGPGQLVVYPILVLKNRDPHAFIKKLMQTVQDLLAIYGLTSDLKADQPGVWVNGAKIASVGVAVKKWVTFHGVALNVNLDLSGFDAIIPCGLPGQALTSMKEILDRELNLTEIKKRFIDQFEARFGYRKSAANVWEGKDQGNRKHPSWLIKPPADTVMIKDMQQSLDSWGLSTVCQSAHCPNTGECYSQGTATFLILGDQCTRNCRFCAVDKGKPHSLNVDEPLRVAEAVQKLSLQYAVVTSVTRDDLIDGGARHFAKTIRMVRDLNPQTRIEVLVPDFNGMNASLRIVCDARPDMFNHNVETVARLYSQARPGASYRRSLKILAYASNRGLPVKSGIMLGLGETEQEVRTTLMDMWKTGCRYLTIGQYLAPSANHLPVARYVTPGEFDNYAETARQIGFSGVASGPLVRSSYRAAEMVSQAIVERNRDMNRQTFEVQSRRRQHANFQ